MVDVGKLLKFPIEDKSWILKVLIGGILSCIPIINFFFFGYILTIMRGAIKGEPARLPEWENWGELFTNGFMVFVIGLGYGVAGFIACTILQLIPIIGILLSFALSLVIGAVVYMAMAMYAESGELKDAFDIKSLVDKLKAVLADWATAYAIVIACSIVGMITLCLYPFASFYIALVTCRMFGEIYPKEVESEEAPTDTPPETKEEEKTK